ncbi:MAG: filamentous hemagglutinin N-terminal domain-containing protein [Vampirovibrio sp.]|nr:filamentous hemagglutinin N-terminal domain-containing protein [Vampirovibrio sp.]
MQHHKLIRSGSNCHRFLLFSGGRLITWTVLKEDFVPGLARLFGLFNSVCGVMQKAFVVQVLLGLLSVLSAHTHSAYALPAGWQVVSGDVHIQEAGSVLNVTSKSNQAIVNYQTFNVGASETVNFFLPNTTSSILNQVLGGNSLISGALNSNGQVLLVNPAGITLSATAQVNTGGFLASTLPIQNQHYLGNPNGSWLFTTDALQPSDQPAAILNNGVIETTPGGFITLISQSVTNGGSLTAPDGQIHLAVGDQVRVHLANNVILDVTVDEVLQQEVAQIQKSITNTGDITANTINLQAQLHEKVQDKLLSQVVNLDGVIQATHINDKNGSITIQGDVVEQQGRLIADGKTDVDGGFIDINASNQVTLREGSLTSAKGNGENSSGGEILVWSDGDTTFEQNAVVDARGGDISGDGGFIELSAVDTVLFAGTAFGQANNGADGTILIDPTDIRIRAAGPAGSATVPYTDADNSGGESVFLASSFNGFANVLLEASNDISVETPWTLNGVTAGNSLTLRAGNDIDITSALTTNGGDINLIADASGVGAGGSDDVGGITVGATITSNGGDISLTGATVDINNAIDAGTTGTVSLLPSTSDPGIAVSGAVDNNDVAGTRLDVSSAELGRITANTVSIGSASLNNDITLIGDIDLTGQVGAAGIYNLTFNTNGNYIATGQSVFLGRDALFFDGGNDHLIALNSPSLDITNDTMTIEAWINLLTNTSEMIVNKEGVYEYAVNGNLYQAAVDTVSGGSWSWGGTQAKTASDWVHAAFVYDGTNWTFYQNGTLLETIAPAGAETGNILSTANDLRIGARQCCGGQNLHGYMDEVRIYNTDLSTAQVQASYNSGQGTVVTGPETNLAGGWNFGEGAGATTADLSGNTNTATLTNGPQWVTAKNLTINAGNSVNTGAIFGDGAEIAITANVAGVSGGIVQDGAVAVDGNGTLTLTTLPNPDNGFDPSPLQQLPEGDNSLVQQAEPTQQLQQYDYNFAHIDTTQIAHQLPQEPGFVPVSNTLTNHFPTIAYQNGGFQLASTDTGNVAYVSHTYGDTVTVINPNTQQVVATIPLGPGRGPTSTTLHRPTNRLYVANTNNHTVSVVDATTYDILDEINVGQRPKNIVVNVQGTKAYTANFGSNSVSIIDTTTRKVINTIDVGAKPVQAAFDESAGYLFVTTYGADGVTVIDPATDKVVGTIPTGAGPRGIVIDESTHTAYVANFLENTITTFNTQTLQVNKTTPLPGNPYGLALDAQNNQLFIATRARSSVAVMDTRTHQIIGTKPVASKVQTTPQSSNPTITPQDTVPPPKTTFTPIVPRQNTASALAVQPAEAEVNQHNSLWQKILNLLH